MTNTLNKIMHNGTEYDFPGDVAGPASSTDGNLAVFDGATGKLIKDGGAVPTSFAPGGTATTGYVVTKTAGGYEWAAPSGGIENVTSGTTTTVTGIRAGTEAEYGDISTPSASVLYFTF